MVKEVGYRPSVIKPGALSASESALRPNAETSGKVRLPSEGKLVVLQVLEKSGELYKILLNGSVFSTSLPLNAKLGEQYVAKVLLSNPLTLDLNTSAGIKAADTATVLSLLGIEENEFSVALTGKLIEEGQPIQSERLKEYSAFLQREQLKINEQVLLLLSAMYKKEGTDPEQFRSKPINLFSETPEIILEQLYSIIRELNNSTTPIVQAVLSSLIVESPAIKESFSAEEYTGIIEYLDSISEAQCSYHEMMQLQALKTTLAKFVMKCAVYHWFGLFPVCVLRKELEMPVLFYFLNSKEIESTGGEHIRLRLIEVFGLELNETIRGILKRKKVITEFVTAPGRHVSNYKADVVNEALSVFGFEGTVISRMKTAPKSNRKSINIAV